MAKNIWWYEDRDNISCCDMLNFEQPSVLIQDLIGTIGGLLGNIEDLGPDTIPTQSLWFGKNDGNILIEDASITTGFETIIASKNWTSGIPQDFYIMKMQFTYQVMAAGTFVIQYSKDNQYSWVNHKTVTISADKIGKRPLVVCSKMIKARQFSWRIVASSGSFELVDFTCYVKPAGYSNPNR